MGTQAIYGTLADSILTNIGYNSNGIGYISANQSLQFDHTPPIDAVYTAGFSSCPNGSLALGNSTIFYQCFDGNLGDFFDTAVSSTYQAITILINPCSAIASIGNSGVNPTTLTTAHALRTTLETLAVTSTSLNGGVTVYRTIASISLILTSSATSGGLGTSSTASSSPSDTTTLAQSTKIALGVAIPLGVALIGALVLYLFLRRKKKPKSGRNNLGSEKQSKITGNNKYESIREMDAEPSPGGPGLNELEAKRVYELESTRLNELEAIQEKKMDRMKRHELEGDRVR